MNLSLLDPFVLAQDCPEAFVGGLHSGHSTCLRFNRLGDFLASGRLDGTVVIFDVETHGVARKLRGHTRQVQSLSWSADGRYLLSSSQDWKCVLWDLKDGSRVRTVRFEAAVFIAELHPWNQSVFHAYATVVPLLTTNYSLLFAAALFDDQPVLVDISGDSPIKRTLPSAPKRTQIEHENATEKQIAQDAKQATTVICWSANGDYIFGGTNRGWLNIIDRASNHTLFSTRLANGIITSLRLTSAGRDILVNSSDRIIRTVPLPDLDDRKLEFDSLRMEPEHRFQDIVNHLSWNNVAFSSSGEYVIASIFMNHHLYVWERGHGSLEKILEGPKEELSSVEWHPHKPFIAATGMDSGRVYLWSIHTPQRWSALAPDFVEVEENVEYVEREDEFDIQPIEEIHKRILNQEDEAIDVLTMEPVRRGFEKGDFQMPVILDADDSGSDDEIVAVGAGQYRRKSPGQGKEWMLDDEAAQSASGDDLGTPRKANSKASTSRLRMETDQT